MTTIEQRKHKAEQMRNYYKTHPEQVEKRKLIAKRYRQANLATLLAYDKARNKTPARLQQARLSRRKNYDPKKESDRKRKQRLSGVSQRWFARYKATHFWIVKFSKGLNYARSKKAIILDRASIREYYRQVFTRSSLNCSYCEKLLTPQTATIDHKTPFSLGGVHAVHNLTISCLTCNVRKNAMPYAKWKARN